MRKVSTNPVSVTVTTALTEILHLEANSMLDDIGIELTNTGATALSDIQILIRFNSLNTYHAVIAAADWAAIIAGTQSLSGFLKAVSPTNPATLAAAGVAWFLINPTGIESISIQAKTASSSTTISVCSAGRTAGR